MTSPYSPGEPSFELNMRYNQLIRQRHSLQEQVEQLSLDNDKLMLQLDKASSLRMAAERRRFEQVHYLNRGNCPDTRTSFTSLPQTDNTDLCLGGSSSSSSKPTIDSPVLVDSPDARTVAKLETEVQKLNQEYKRLGNFNKYLSKEQTLLQVREPSQILVKFYNITDPCAARPFFLSCSRDSLIDDIVASLPSDWNVSLCSQFAGFENSQLCVFNKPGSKLRDRPGWISYLEQGGCVFVSESRTDSAVPDVDPLPEEEKILSPPLESGSDSGKQPRGRKRISCELEGELESGLKADSTTQPRKRARLNNVKAGASVVKTYRSTRKRRANAKK